MSITRPVNFGLHRVADNKVRSQISSLNNHKCHRLDTAEALVVRLGLQDLDNSSRSATAMSWGDKANWVPGALSVANSTSGSQREVTRVVLGQDRKTIASMQMQPLKLRSNSYDVADVVPS